MLLTTDFDKDFFNEEYVAVTSVFSFQSPGVNGSKLDAPEADCFSGYGDAPFGEQVFYISMAEVESEVEPDRIGNDVRRKTVALVCIHLPSLAVLASLLVSTL